jgi:hypothetical protein
MCLICTFYGRFVHISDITQCTFAETSTNCCEMPSIEAQWPRPGQSRDSHLGLPLTRRGCARHRGGVQSLGIRRETSQYHLRRAMLVATHPQWRYAPVRPQRVPAVSRNLKKSQINTYLGCQVKEITKRADLDTASWNAHQRRPAVAITFGIPNNVASASLSRTARASAIIEHRVN